MTSSTPDISVVLTAHRVGLMAGVSARSVLEAVEHVRQSIGKTAEVIVVLDRADELTTSVLKACFGSSALYETNEGDPGQSKLRGVERARGKYTGFLDDDDLWSFNWLTEAYKLVENNPDAVAHPQCNIVFGEVSHLWWHVDSEGAIYQAEYFAISNYWTSLSFARTEVYRRFPYKPNDLKLGFRFEDWHWNKVTLANGLVHKPVPNTVHFIRSRKDSVSRTAAAIYGTAWPLTESDVQPGARHLRDIGRGCF